MGDIDFQRRRILLSLMASGGALLLPRTALSQNLDVAAQIAQLRGSIGTELASPLARLGLLNFAGWFRDARIETKPLGYEADITYRDGSQAALSALDKIIPTFKTEGIQGAEPDHNFVSDLSDAFQKNLQSNKIVFSSVRAFAPPLQNFTDDQFIHFQLMIALIMQQNAHDTLQLASKITFIYPFC